MDVRKSLQKLKELVEKEKNQLDGILRGAELLADMLITEGQSGNKEDRQQRSEPGLEKTGSTEPSAEG